MFALYELVGLLPKSFQPTFSAKLNELFLFLRTRPGLSEKEAAKAFLGSASRSKYFNNLKNALKKQLIGYVVVYPTVWANVKYKRILEGSYKSFATYKILLLTGSRQAAIEIAKSLLVDIQKIELHALIYVVATDLQFHFSGIENSPQKAKMYGKLASLQAEIVKAEAMVRDYHSIAGLICNTRESFTPTMIAQLKDAERNTKPLLRLGSSQLNRLIYNIIISRYIVEYDYVNIIKYSNEALQSFPKEHPNYITFRFAFIQKQLSALVATGQTTEAKILAKEACQLVTKGKFNWHLILMRRIVICLHSKDYQEAYELFKAHAQYKCTYKALAEYWNIIRGYIYFLIQVGKIEQYDEERFSLGKFLNEMTLYSHDKTGNNINILIIQIIIQLQRNQYGLIIDWIESLGAYARSYTRKPETARANIFINMIVKMESASFHRAGTERKTKKLLEKLQATPLKLRKSLAIEIVPYEVLWNAILELLENKFRGTTTKVKTTQRPKKYKD